MRTKSNQKIKTTIYVFLILTVFILACNPIDEDTGMIKYALMEDNSFEGIENLLIVDSSQERYFPYYTLNMECKIPEQLEKYASTNYYDTIHYFKTHISCFDEDGSPVIVNPELAAHHITFFDTTDVLSFSSPAFTHEESSLFAGKYFKISNTVTIPVIVFSEIPEGNRNLVVEVEIAGWSKQQVINADSSITVLNTKEEVLLSKRIRFPIYVPPILKTSFLVSRVKIANESFTGDWDYKVFGPGTPDVFYEFFYPSGQYSSNKQYRSSSYTNTQDCLYNDTINFYHFSKNENVSFSIWDWDNVSGNDYISGWQGPLFSEAPINETYNIPQFSKLEAFEIVLLASDKVN